MERTRSGTDVVEVETLVAARPETVWEFFTVPEKMVRWKGRKAELDPRPGGIYRVEIKDVAIARGEYIEIVPHSRLVISWGWEGEGSVVAPGSSRVEITLTPEGDGTLVRLRHLDLPTAEERGSHREGWTHYLARLAVAGAGGDPGPDPQATSPA